MAGKISKTQGEELLRLVDEVNYVEVFELLKKYECDDNVANSFNREYVAGNIRFDFPDRLKVHINNLIDENQVVTEFDIFFSFSSKNRKEAEPIAKLLQECGLVIFFADESLQKFSGQDFRNIIDKALNNSKHFVLLCTPDAMASIYVHHEYTIFYKTVYLPSRQQRRLFILEGSGFDIELINNSNSLTNINATKNIGTIISILGKTLPKNDLAEKKDKYKKLFKLFFKISPKIEDSYREQLVIRQEELKLSDGQVLEIENEVINEFENERIAAEKEKMVIEKGEKEGIIVELIRILQLTAEKAEQEKLAVKKAKQERIAAEKKKIAKEKAEQERIATEKIKKEELTWYNAKTDNFYYSYKNYLAIYPNGKYAIKAKNLVEQLVETQKEQDRLAKAQNEDSTIQNETITNPTNKTKSRNYFVIAAVTFALLLGGGYGVVKEWNKNNKEEQERLAKIAKQKQDSIRIQDSINNVIAQHEKDSLDKIIEAQNLQNTLQAKKIKDSIDFIANITWQKLEAFEKNSKYGFRDKKTKRVVIPTQYNYADSFSEGLALVEKGGLWGFIDKTGKEVIKPQYGDANSFSEGLAFVQKGKLWGFIDKTGKEVIKPQYDYASNFSEGLARVKKGSLYRFIDKTGKEVIKPQYDEAGNFSEGLARVKKGSLHGFIDKTGKEVIKLQYDWAVTFSEGLAAVQKGKLWGFIDKTGEEVIKLQYDGAFRFSEGLAQVKKNGKWFYINKQGECVKDCPE